MNITALKRLFVFCTCALIAGCAATGPAYVDAPLPKDNDTLVYIYRPDNWGWNMRDAYFYVNDINIADLSSNGYTWFHVPAGEYSLKQRWPADLTYLMKDIVIPVKWSSLRKYYYRLLLHSAYGYKTTEYQWEVVEVPEAQALEEIRKCKLQPPLGLQKLIQQINR